MDLLKKMEMYTWDGVYKDEVNEENEWQNHIKKMLNGRSLGDMDDEETKKFFDDAKKSYKGKKTDEGELPPALKKAIDAKKKKDGDDEEDGESKKHEDGESEKEEKEEHKKDGKKDKADK